MTALLGGEIDLIIEGLGSAASHIRGEKIRAVAVTSPKRSPAFPEIPTMAEVGLPKAEHNFWVGAFAPAKTPPDILKKMTDGMAQILAEPAIKARFADRMLSPDMEPEQSTRNFTAMASSSDGGTVGQKLSRPAVF